MFVEIKPLVLRLLFFVFSKIFNVPDGIKALPELIKFSFISISPTFAPPLVRFCEKFSLNNKISFLSAYDKLE